MIVSFLGPRKSIWLGFQNIKMNSLDFRLSVDIYSSSLMWFVPHYVPLSLAGFLRQRVAMQMQVYPPSESKRQRRFLGAGEYSAQK